VLVLVCNHTPILLREVTFVELCKLLDALFAVQINTEGLVVAQLAGAQHASAAGRRREAFWIKARRIPFGGKHLAWIKVSFGPDSSDPGLRPDARYRGVVEHAELAQISAREEGPETLAELFVRDIGDAVLDAGNDAQIVGKRP